MATATARREELKPVWEAAKACTRCPQLAAGRTHVVFGAGNADADLMFVGEAPGANEDRLGLPFVGQAGRLLDTLLGEIGLQRADVFVANVLKCLRHDAPVQLGDGSWERIGRLVNRRYDGTVMSVDDDGRLVPRRVTGWHRSERGSRRIIRLSFRGAKPSGSGKANVELTEDHRVLTQGGWKPAGDLQRGDLIATGQGLSDLARDVVVGTLLGDGSISSASAHLTWSHAADQAAYAQFKADLVEELAPVTEARSVRAVAGGRTYGVVQTRTLAHRSLQLLRADFYRDRKVVPGWVADELNARMLSVWFLDGGSMRIRDGRQPHAEIATNGFSDEDRRIVLRGLLRLGLPAKASRQRIHFDATASRRLSEVIAPFVPEAMRYKLHPEVELAMPFEAALLKAGPPRTLYDEVEFDDVTGASSPRERFFCIDVEETHNFVTTGGVVHNCRPPGNRDPAPVEIENCSDYLVEQIRLIEPRVICTLGNFATKLLRADPTGITRLHGRPEEREVLGVRRVRLYPLLHPAAALYTPRMLETLREDFARLPDLLALAAVEQPEAVGPEPEPEPEPVSEPRAEPAPLADPEPDPVEQLGLF